MKFYAFDTSQTLHERAKKSIVGGVNSPARAFKSVGGTPLFVTRSEGCHIWDADGNKYIDFIGSWGPMIAGHAHPDVIKAVNAGGVEDSESEEISVRTGPYQLDYGDGHDPNAFDGYTLNNLGVPLGNNAYIEDGLYNGETGNIRKLVLNPGEKNTIGLNSSNINDATLFSFRIRSEESGAKFQIKLKSTDGIEDVVPLQSSIGSMWQEMHYYIGTSFSNIDLSDMAAIEIISDAGNAGVITLYFDEVEFNTIPLAGNRLDVKIRNGADDSLTTAVNFGASTSINPRVLAEQYLDIDYVCEGSWGIQIYTDNKAEDAYPKFTGTGDRANGLIGMTNSGYRVAMIWQVWQEKQGYYDGSKTVEFDTTVDDGDRAEFAFVMDKSDSDWEADQYVRNYRTLINYNGELGAPVPLADPPPGYWPRVGTAGDPVYVYLGADFTGVPAQTYTTSKLTLDIYND